LLVKAADSSSRSNQQTLSFSISVASNFVDQLFLARSKQQLLRRHHKIPAFT